MSERPRSARTSGDSGSWPASTDGALELRLSTRRGDVETDLVVRAESWATVRDLLEALELAQPPASGGTRDKMAVVCERLGAWLDLDSPIGGCDLLDGDRLLIGRFAELREATEVAGAAVPGSVDVAIHGGPRAGERMAVAPGEYVAGRDPRSATIAFPGDSSMSGRHLRIVVEPGSVAVEDVGSTNGTFLDGVQLPFRTLVPVPAASLLELGRTSLSWNHTRAVGSRTSTSDGRGGIALNRPPRVRRPWTPEVQALTAPPEAPRRTRIPILASLVPIILGVALAGVTGHLYMLLFALMGPVIAIASRLEELGLGSRDFKKRSAAFREQFAAAETMLESMLARETQARRSEAPDAGTLLRRPSERSPELWVRRPRDPDVLDVRIGSADQPARSRITLGAGGSPELRQEAEAALAHHDTVRSVPVIVPLAQWGSVGIAGPRERVDALGRWMVLQAAILQPPSELRICAALSPARVAAWDWMKWLPHVRTQNPSGDGELVSGGPSATALLDGLLAEVASGAKGLGRRTLVIFDGSLAPDARQVARLLGVAVEGGVSVVWLAEDSAALPNGMAAIVGLDRAAARLDLVEVASGVTVSGASADGVPLAVAEATARTMAPLRDPAQATAAEALPHQVSLLAATGANLAPEAIGRSWARAQTNAVLGMTSTGPLVVDLARDGPHALVGGTTGSGKSELLQALVASLALANPPTRISFLLVDYKGGAAFRDTVSLPHVAGFVTDLDEHLAHRALVSLDAEIRRREALLASLGAKDIESALVRDPASTPARLLIVVDEFATLAREVPAFIDGLVDVARRGRTLGVHLVLATQRPAGVVTREIWANTNLRIALRVTDTTDSVDVVGIPDAAAIPRELPGRAILRVGQADPVVFQAAWVGARQIGGNRAAVVIHRLSFTGLEVLARAPGVVAASASSQSDEPAPTELDLVTAAIREASRLGGFASASSPWLPPLQATLPLATLTAGHTGSGGTRATIGLVDDPAHQLQDPLTVDLEVDGGMLVYGGGGSGRTTALRTIAVSLADGVSPADLQVYGLDFGAGGLRMLEVLPHCGGIASGSDEERVARLLGSLRSELDRRQAVFAERRVHDISEYRAALAPGESLPRIVLLLDGYAGFAAAYERVQFGELVDLLPRLVADGRAVGLHVFVTADRRGTVPSRLAGVVKRRLVLRMADEGEYGQLGIDRNTWSGIRFEPGRGLIDDGLEVQLAIAGSDPSAAGQRDAVAQLAARARADWPGIIAPVVGVLPTTVSTSSLGECQPGSGLLGILDQGLAPVAVDLDEGSFLVAGPLRSGRSTALVTIASSYAAATPGAKLYLLAARRSPLTGLSSWASVAQGPDACDALVDRIAREGDPEDGRRLIVIDDAEELFESASAATLATLVRRGRDSGLRVLAAAELRSASRAYGGWLAEIRKDRHGLLLQPGQEMAGELLGATLPRPSASRPMPPGRGYLVVRGIPELVQVSQA